MRINRLVVTDVITSPVREWVAQRDPGFWRFLALILSCVWCTGVYTAFAVMAYVHWLMEWNWALYPLTALAVAWLSPVISTWLED